MKKTGIFYSFNTKNTSKVAEMIIKEFGEDQIDKVNVEDTHVDEFTSYENYILGVPTWWDGELPNYWDEFLPALEDAKMKDKKVAIFGLGDQKGYPENFVDGIGIMADLMDERGAKIVGKTSTQGFEYENSVAERDGKFLGLALDEDNQADKTSGRVKKWVKNLKKTFD